MPGRPLLQKAGLFGSDKAWKIGRGGDTVSAFTATDGLSEGRVTKGRSALKAALGEDSRRRAP